MEQEILAVLRYFSQFKYPPTLQEIRTYLDRRASLATLRRSLTILQNRRRIVEKSHRYTIPPYSTYLRKYIVRTRNSKLKIQNSKLYIQLLSLFPQIQLIGYSGSVSMMNAKKNDDIDLFIICERDRLWTGRFLALSLAQLFGKRRKRGETHTQNKICLNLFFEKTDMTIPKEKRSRYVAHEVLQMKPVMSKNKTYEQFLQKNTWVFDMFPNAFDTFRDSYNFQFPVRNSQKRKSELFVNWKLKIGNFFEWILGMVQKFYIRRHQTTELITQHQLWFHPDDFEKKLYNK